MIDRLFTAALTFSVLTGATFAIGSEWLESRSSAAQNVVRLPAVEIVAKRSLPPMDVARNEVGEAAANRVH